MGAWGKKFYENDDTCDIRDSYLSQLKECETDEEAYFKTLEQMREYLEKEDDALIFWAALADTQWNMGRLREDVKAEAEVRIKRSLDDPQTSQDTLPGFLRDELRSILNKLSRPLPKKKRILRLYTADQDPWELNDVYAYQFHMKSAKEAGYWGKYIAIQKIGSQVKFTARGKAVMQVQVFDRVFDTIPTIAEVKETRLLPLDNPHRSNISHDVEISPGDLRPKSPIEMNIFLVTALASAYPKKHLFYIGNMEAMPNRNNKPEQRDLGSWDDIDRNLIFWLTQWKDLEYIDLGNGIFDYQGD